MKKWLKLRLEILKVFIAVPYYFFNIYIYTHTSCVKDVLAYGIRRRASKGHVSKLPRYGTKTYHGSLSNLNYVDFPSCHPPFLTLVQHPAGRTNHIPCILHVPAEIISCIKWYLSDFTNNEKQCNHSSLYNSQAFNPLNINLNHFISITMFFFRKRNLPFFPGEKIPSTVPLNTFRFPHLSAKASDVDMNMASGRSLLPDPSWVWSCKCQHASVAWKPTV